VPTSVLAGAEHERHGRGVEAQREEEAARGGARLIERAATAEPERAGAEDGIGDEAAEERGAARLFLEMRDGNPAESLYRRAGFEPVGRRRNYYRNAAKGPLDAITYARG